MRLPAKLYQNAIASVVQTMADRKNSFGRGKNETNIVCIQSQIRGFAVRSYLLFMAKIKAFGADVIEGNTPPPISISVDNGVSVRGSQGVQIGGQAMCRTSLWMLAS